MSTCQRKDLLECRSEQLHFAEFTAVHASAMASFGIVGMAGQSRK